MTSELPHRKKIRHYHEPGDIHEFTFSCYLRRPLLTNDAWRRALSRAIDEAGNQFSFQLIAFVYMPEHVHLLTYPIPAQPKISEYLAAIKRPVSVQVKADLEQAGSPLLKKLTVRERPGKFCFRFWQEGPGYDRNLETEVAIMAAIDYFHLNPVRRKLCRRAEDWKWSSARFYLRPELPRDSDLPYIHGPPVGLFS